MMSVTSFRNVIPALAVDAMLVRMRKIYCHAAPKIFAPDTLPGTRRELLARLLPLWPSEIDDVTEAGRERVVRLLARALRQERCRARRGHWAYDVARHATLARLHKQEAAELDRIKRRAPRANSSA